MSTHTHRSYSQFSTAGENSHVGRVKISQQNLIALAAHRVSVEKNRSFKENYL